MQKAFFTDEARNGRFLTTAFKALERETIGITHGIVTLTIHVKDGHLLRYVTSRERSFVPSKPMTGGNDGK
jgi:hypothetical protein